MRQLLAGMSAALAAGAVVTALLGWRLPYDGVVTAGTKSMRSMHNEPNDTSTSVRLEVDGKKVAAEDLVWSRKLRVALYDPPPLPKPAPAPPPAPPPLRIQLQGTAVENDPAQSQAIILDGLRQMRFVHVGDVVEEAEILAIDATSVTLRYHGDERKLTLEEKGGR